MPVTADAALDAVKQEQRQTTNTVSRRRLYTRLSQLAPPNTITSIDQEFSDATLPPPSFMASAHSVLPGSTVHKNADSADELDWDPNLELPPIHKDDEEHVEMYDISGSKTARPDLERSRIISGMALAGRANRGWTERPLFTPHALITVKQIRPAPLHSRSKSKIESPEKLARMEVLRSMFVERLRYYLGVPYRRGVQPKPDSVLGPGADQEDLYLDCCGLIRKCVSDLKEEFGFELAPFNQGYQFDTLPIKLAAHQMRPGDLIFVEGILPPDTDKKRPPHNIVHVEAFTGGETGEGTIGARNRYGVVEEHRSFKFSTQHYIIRQYHFRSLDTWLSGQCFSHCPRHRWIHATKCDAIPTIERKKESPTVVARSGTAMLRAMPSRRELASPRSRRQQGLVDPSFV